MKFYHVGFVCVLMGSWSVVYPMELQAEQSQEIVIARAKTLLELGKTLVESKEYEKAREYLEEAATQGADKVSAVGARVQLGELYYGGLGVAIDYEKAHECFAQAAHQKEDLKAQVVACQHLGEMYLLGRGVENDYQKAGVYFQVLNNPEIKEAGFSVSSVALKRWRLIEPQLERVYGIIHDEVNAVQLRKEIIAEYGKLDANCLIELIHALDYADIPLLLEIACNVVMKSDLGELSFEQINSLPGDIGYRIISDKILASCGPMPAKELAVCRGHDYSVSSVCVTADGKIVSGAIDKTICVWDMQGNQLAVWRAHQDVVKSVSVTADGKIVSGSYDKTVCVWDMQGKKLAECRGHVGVNSVCVMDDGKIISGSWDRTIRVWDMRGKELAICRGHEGEVFSVCVTKDEKILSGALDRTIRVWDMQGNQLAICRGHAGPVYSVCVAADGKIVSGSWDRTIRVWDMQGKELVICRGHEAPVESVCVTTDGKIVSGSRDKTVRVWDMQGKLIALCSHERWVNSVCPTKDGKIVSGSNDANVRVWDIELLGRIVSMGQDQAQAVWELLQSISQKAEIGKQELWKEVEKLLEEDSSLAQSKIITIMSDKKDTYE